MCESPVISGASSPDVRTREHRSATAPAADLGSPGRLISLGQPRRRVAVYGGSYDPVTDAHLKVAAECIHSGVVDEVWMIPCGRRRDKVLGASPLHRLIMTHMAVSATFGSRFPVKVMDTEVFLENALPTYQLMKKLTTEHPHDQFFFVLGADLIPGLPRWENGEQLRREQKFLVVPRPGYTLPLDMPANFVMVERQSLHFSSVDLSSSEIRKRLRMNVNLVEGLIPPPVIAHIVRYELYERGELGPIRADSLHSLRMDDGSMGAFDERFHLGEDEACESKQSMEHATYE